MTRANETSLMSQAALVSLLGLVLVILFVVSLMLGSNPIPLIQAAKESLLDTPTVTGLIFSEIRMPRALIAVFAGATLGLCGAAMQGLLRNPLASPGLIGSATGAALGAVVMLYFGMVAILPYALSMGGMLGALAATLLVYLLAGRDAGTLTLILAGVAINALAMALISLILNLAPSPYAVREIVLWMMGSVANHSMADVKVLLPGVILGWLLLIGTGRALDALTLGEDTATSMGFNLARLRWRIFIAVALAVGSAVSITGAIGFIGLVVPHLLRPWVGFQPSKLLPVSALGGAILLLAADIATRLFPAGTDIKVGVLTAVVGAPFFLYLVIKSRRFET